MILVSNWRNNSQHSPVKGSAISIVLYHFSRCLISRGQVETWTCNLMIIEEEGWKQLFKMQSNLSKQPMNKSSSEH